MPRKKVPGKPFVPGDPRAGRPRGATSRDTRLLKDAIMLASRLTGDVSLIEARSLKNARAKLKAIAALYNETEEDAAKRGGLVGWLCYLAREHPQSFASLLAKVLPLQLKLEANELVTYQSMDDIQRDIRAMKLPLRRLMPLLADMTGTIIEGQRVDASDDDEQDDDSE
jgi:hypothetical protein